jgi:hypothetical protein
MKSSNKAAVIVYITVCLVLCILSQTGYAMAPQHRQGEFLVDTTIVTTPGLGEQREPAVAFDGTNYFLVWTEYRNGFSHIYGTRVNQDGEMIDSISIPIAATWLTQQSPAVGFNGTCYLVVWEDTQDTIVYGYTWYMHAIRGARINQSGTVLDTVPITIDLELYSVFSYAPAVTSNGTDFFVVWQSRIDCHWRVYGIRISPAGIVLDPEGIPVSALPQDQKHPSVAFDGTNYLVVWAYSDYYGYDPTAVYGNRVTQSGVVLDSLGFVISAAAFSQKNPSVAFDGTNYLVAWEQKNQYSWCDIYCARVSSAGVVLDSTAVPVSTAQYSQRYPAVSYCNSKYCVIWQDFRSDSMSIYADIYGARVDPSGTVLDTAGIVISWADSTQTYPVVTAGMRNFFIVWQDERHAATLQYDTYGARMTLSGNVLDPWGIPFRSKVPGLQCNPACAFDGTNYMVVWEDYRNASYPEFYSDIYGIRLDQDGNTLDTVAFPISTAFQSQITPGIDFDGENYLAVWADLRDTIMHDIRGSRITPIGTVLDPEGIQVSSIQNECLYPNIAFKNSCYLIAWIEKYYYRVIGARVLPTGVVLDTAGFIMSDIGVIDGPGIAGGNENFFVIWEQWPEMDIYGTRVTQTGIVLDTAGICISNEPMLQSDPEIGFDGENFLAVWEDSRNSPSFPEDSFDIYCARVTPSGNVLDSLGFALSTAPAYQSNPAITFSDANYLIAWEDEGDGFSHDIHGIKVTPSGVAFDSCVLVQQPRMQVTPCITAGNSGQALLTYTGWAEVHEEQPVKTMRIWAKMDPFPGIEETSSSKPLKYQSIFVSPNPFQHTTAICVNVESTPENLVLNIYDISGRLVRHLEYSTQQRFPDRIIWDGTDDTGTPLACGVYFCAVECGDTRLVEKIVMLK